MPGSAAPGALVGQHRRQVAQEAGDRRFRGQRHPQEPRAAVRLAERLEHHLLPLHTQIGAELAEVGDRLACK